MRLPGDILLYRVTPKSSLLARLIAVAQLLRREGESEKNYSHVSILEDEGHQIEAVWPRSRRSVVDWSDKSIEVWRVVGIDPAIADKAVAAARSKIGLWYNLAEILFGFSRSKHSAICTRLVADCWASQGIDLSRGAGKILSPNELVSSRLIARVL